MLMMFSVRVVTARFQLSPEPSVFPRRLCLTKVSATNFQLTKYLKLRVSVVGVEAKAVVSVVGVAAGVEVVSEEASRIVLQVASRSHKARARTSLTPDRTRTPIQGIRLNVIQILLLSRPVTAIGPSESQLTFVWNQGHARGRTSGSPSPTNETLTSSTIITTIVNSMTCYTETDYQKYIH